ncbi:MAG: c-type cytochrome [Gemmatimonadetes bacterium]|uniref:C-type cytochrome n=1 Tax=Candidatus Kutchimonas denitrificans TaxID=3056748 RepID=A0AAE4Z703_9BACT|nr:c-type cytochrome [Gemmatimonadota bacterium]NIR73627.1 c-type cytochrome [Candidatus Kutchimonas denitrificans]NIR99586.1 c-type cytochrome [Gemmatimonadota bacterium]NIT65206.1 c-type cytochrome [Gemmatimonadota bacterium]NIV23739.1 c-type cytochrome [Gemmatimonadota bacterium]
MDRQRIAWLTLSNAALVVLTTGPALAQMPIEVAAYNDRPPVNEQTIAEGKRIYDLSCVHCHGTAGRGDGPVAYFLNRSFGPHPRNFTDGVFKFRSTYSGDAPTDEDLFRSVTKGIPGFMPGFNGLAPAERWKVIYYIKTFLPEDLLEFEPEVVEIVGEPLPANAASIRRGYEVYQQLNCWECHGPGGQGDGPKAPDLEDDWGFPLPSADLTRPSSFKNGSRPEDIYRTIVTGLDGGAMTSFVDMMRGREEDIWHLVNFVLALSR